MSPRDINDELSGLDKAWKDVSENGSIALPDGMYTMKTTAATIARSQNGRLQIVETITVMVGEHAGKEVKQYTGLDKEQSLGFFKRAMSKCELALPESMTELPGWIQKNLVGLVFLGQAKNKDGFLNIYKQKKVMLDPTAGMPSAPPSPGSAPAGGGPKLGM